MIYGVECSEQPASSGGPSTSAVGWMNFITGDYQWGGVSMTLAQAISTPAAVTVNGLESGTAGHAVAPSIISTDFIAFFNLCSFTAVITFDAQADSLRTELLALEEWNTGSESVISWLDAGSLFESNDLDGGREAKDSTNGTQAPGLHKIATTRTNAKVRLSMDGFPLGTDGSFENLLLHLPDPRDTGASYDGGSTTAPFTAFNNFHLGGTLTDDFNAPGVSGSPVYIKSLYLYDPVDDTLLPGLSA